MDGQVRQRGMSYSRTAIDLAVAMGESKMIEDRIPHVPLRKLPTNLRHKGVATGYLEGSVNGMPSHLHLKIGISRTTLDRL